MSKPSVSTLEKENAELRQQLAAFHAAEKEHERLEAEAAVMREALGLCKRGTNLSRIEKALSTTAGTDLLAKLDRYGKALQFYSDSTRWEKCYAVGNLCESIEDGDPMMVFLDGEDRPWSVAIEALGRM